MKKNLWNKTKNKSIRNLKRKSLNLQLEQMSKIKQSLQYVVKN